MDSSSILIVAHSIVVIYTFKSKKTGISMKEKNHCYEIGMVKQVNIYIKHELYLNRTFTTVVHSKRAAKKCNLFIQRNKNTFTFRLQNRKYRLYMISMKSILNSSRISIKAILSETNASN